MSKKALKEIQSDDHTEAMTEAPSIMEKDGDPQDELVHVMHDHLDVMLAIILKLREDPEYAAHIYSDCPRLQYILDQHPDLRPIFEDPKFVRINFEQVYKKAGGLLPEDRPNIMMKILRIVVNHPLFKVLKVLLFIKKIVSCIFGGGIGLMSSMCFPNAVVPDAEAAAAAAAAADADAPFEGSPENQETREALYNAADYMEQPDVQEKMRVLLESNPENLDEAIEQDPELKALRDANPLCAELMKDPETMQILVDPDNLRALADCPDMIEQDFTDPDWTPPEVTHGTFDETTVVPVEEVETGEVPVEEEEEGMEVPEFEEPDDDRQTEAGRGSRSSRSLNNSKRSVNSRGSSIYSSLKDYVAAEIVGSSADSMMGLDAVDTAALDQASAAADAVDAAEANASNLDSVADMAGNVEETMDKIEETHDDKLNESNSNAAFVGTTTAAGGAAGVAATSAVPNDKEASEKDDEDTETRSFRSEIGSIFTSFTAAAKEKLATTLLGDELGEHLIEKMEENEEDSEEEKEQGKGASTRRLGSII